MGDADYLVSNSKQTSHLALIDSAERSTAVWPTAARFDVVFDTPFPNVYGIDLLSVNVPRTEYNVSASRNALCFSFGTPEAGQKHRVLIPEGDYDTQTLQAAVNTALEAFVSAAGNALALQATSASVNTVSLSCAEPFTVYLSESSIRVVLGFGDPVDPASTLYSAPAWVPGGPDTVTSVLTAAQGAVTLGAFQGASAPGTSTMTLTAQTPITQAFTASYGGACAMMTLGVASVGQPPASPMTWEVRSYDGVLAAAGTIQPDTDSPDTLSRSTATTTPVAMEAGQVYTLALMQPENSDASNCYALRVGPAVQDSSQLTFGGLARPGCLVTTLGVREASSTVTGPGRLDLTGERYIVLRCLEVESAINGSRAFERFNAGIGMIQLGTYGYSNQTYDYSAYPPRSFNPIANLFKLSLSFQKPDGSLYDFKGLNLQVLLLIRYLVPDEKAPRASVRPAYTPSLAEAQSKHLQEQVTSDGRYYWCA